MKEKYITGDSTDYEKFLTFAKTMENCIGNPIFHWSCLELKRYFGIDEILNEQNAEQIWEKANKYIVDNEYSPKKIISLSNVDVVCTTDSPLDDLKWHKEIKDTNFKTSSSWI